MIFDTENDKIVRLAVAGQSTMTDGCALWDADNGEMVTGSYTQGTIENPANHLVEVFRLAQGERGEIDCKCDDCPFIKNGEYDEDMIDEYGDCRLDCCINAYVNNDFEDEFEDYFKESVEEQVRDLISEVVSDDLSKLDEIRIAISDIDKPYDYVNVRMNNTYERDVLDNLVDMAIDSEFVLAESKEFLDGEIIHFSLLCDDRDEDVEFWAKLQEKINDFDLDGALELLQ